VIEASFFALSNIYKPLFRDEYMIVWRDLEFRRNGKTAGARKNESACDWRNRFHGSHIAEVLTKGVGSPRARADRERYRFTESIGVELAVGDVPTRKR